MNRKYIALIILITIILTSALYFLFIRDWIKPASVNIDNMRNVSCFTGNTENRYTVFKGIFEQCKTGSSVNNDEIRTTNNDKDYERITTIDEEYLSLTYYFGGTTEVDNGIVEVNIYTNPQFKFNIFTGPDFNMPLSSLETTLRTKYRKEYGRFSPIFNVISQHNKENNFEYYISPLIYVKDELGSKAGSGGTIDMVFIYYNYCIYLHEGFKNKENLNYSVALDDLNSLLKSIE